MVGGIASGSRVVDIASGPGVRAWPPPRRALEYSPPMSPRRWSRGPLSVSARTRTALPGSRTLNGFRSKTAASTRPSRCSVSSTSPIGEGPSASWPVSSGQMATAASARGEIPLPSDRLASWSRRCADVLRCARAPQAGRRQRARLRRVVSGGDVSCRIWRRRRPNCRRRLVGTVRRRVPRSVRSAVRTDAVLLGTVPIRPPVPRPSTSQCGDEERDRRWLTSRRNGFGGRWQALVTSMLIIDGMHWWRW